MELRPVSRAVGLLVLAYLAVGLAAPRAASAQLYAWDYVCSVGNVTRCASFALSLQYDALTQPYGSTGVWVPEGITRARLSFRNLQGASGLPVAPPWQLKNLFLDGLQNNWTTQVNNNYRFYGTFSGVPSVVSIWPGGGATLSADRPVQRVGNPFVLYNEAVASRGALLSNGLYSGGFGYTANNEGGLYGCDQPQGTGIGTGGWWGGCGTTLDLSIALPGKWTMAENTSLVWGLGASGCVVGVTCKQITVPEPSTYLLMLTGLLGLGFVAWRRRETLAA